MAGWLQAIIVVGALLMIILSGNGCAPDVVYQSVPVETPVGIPCKVPAVQQPAWATNGITRQNTLFEQIRALLAVNEQHKAYETTLVAANNSCQ